MDEVGLWKRVSLKLGPERSPIEGGKCSPGGVRQKARGGGSPFPSFLFFFFLFSFPFFPPWVFALLFPLMAAVVDGRSGKEVE